LNKKAIYSVHLPEDDVVQISAALSRWFARQSIGNEQWEGWKEDEAQMLISLIERVSDKIPF
jgi:hypothetical protein